MYVECFFYILFLFLGGCDGLFVFIFGAWVRECSIRLKCFFLSFEQAQMENILILIGILFFHDSFINVRYFFLTNHSLYL